MSGLISSVLGRLRRDRSLHHKLDAIAILGGRNIANQIRHHAPFQNLDEAEFRVFSQFGDDGIIQYLLSQMTGIPESFVEFGVENYTESNTRFLLMNNNWSGLILDANPENIRSIQNDQIYWRHDVVAVEAFIKGENINALIRDNGFGGELGLLSIDIDGNDYWIWKAIDAASPVIVICEYNSVFGKNRPVAIPYQPSFRRSASHFSNLFWGCSLPALCMLAEGKGYAFVGCNSHGNNAYFVRRDHLGQIPEQSIESGYRESRFRESRSESGELTYLRGSQRRVLIADLELVDVESGRMVKVGDVA